MIDLNSIVFDDFITIDKAKVLKLLTQEQIFSKYIGQEFKGRNIINSPLREDNVPSFAIFYHKHYSDRLMFYDFATKDTGDCFTLVSRLYQLNFGDTIAKILSDFGLLDSSKSSTKHTLEHSAVKIIKRDKVKIEIKSRDWLKKDKQFWQQFGIKKSTLEKYWVKPVSHIFYNDYVVTPKDICYGYEEYKDEETTYKIYQPYEEKQFKWINNANYSVHQGYRQLPKQGPLLIITKSLKDVMSLYDMTGIASVGLQSESVTIKPSVLQEYKERFEKVIFLFDNDTPGVNFSKMMQKETGLDYFLIPNGLPNVKDFSDLVKEFPAECMQIFKNALQTLNKNE